MILCFPFYSIVNDENDCGQKRLLIRMNGMLSTLYLIRNPEVGWERLAGKRRSLLFVFLGYFLPLMLITAIGEGLGIAEWRTLSTESYGVVHFNLSRVVVFEIMHMAVTLGTMATCAYFIWLLREPFHGKYHYGEALALVMCSLSPLLLCLMLNGIPKISLWVSWGAGLFLSLRILHYGIRRFSKTDPRNADGLFVISAAVVIALTGVERYLLIQSFSGHMGSINNVIMSVAAKLPF